MKSKNIIFAVILAFLSLINHSFLLKSKLKLKVQKFDPTTDLFKDYSHLAENLLNRSSNIFKVI